MNNHRQTNEPAIGLVLGQLTHAFDVQPVFSIQTCTIAPGEECLIRGHNGSGKSTLGSILAGELTPSHGSLVWNQALQPIPAEALALMAYRVSPATALHPDLNIDELVEFQSQFRGWRRGMDPLDWLKMGGLHKHRKRMYSELSSGMQQRVKLALALTSDAGLVVLDEPCANLDESGTKWYRDLLQEIKGLATLIVCSNDRLSDYIAPETTITL